MAAPVSEVLIFEVERQRHAVPAADVQELLPAMTIMPVPGLPAGMEGVINLRGTIVPVLDVRSRFGLPARPMALADHFIVIRNNGRALALHVDHAVHLAPLDSAAVTCVDSAGPGSVRAPRVAKIGDTMVLLHDIAELLDASMTRGTESEAAQ